MGRGNVCVHGKYEGLYYIDWNKFFGTYEDDNGNEVVDENDYDLQHMIYEDSMEMFIEDFTKKFPSFAASSGWLQNEEKVLMENNLFYIVTEDNEWSVAIKLIQKEQDYYSKGNIENLQSKHYKNYLEGIKNILFLQFEELGTYCGAWTSGKTRREQIPA